MPRPKKFRKVCSMPKFQFFASHSSHLREPVIMTVEEYETIRLIDKQGFSQEECGTYMRVARTTVQQIYGSARKKLAIAIIDGRPLRIEGGDYELCDGKHETCDCGGCLRHSQNKKEEASQ